MEPNKNILLISLQPDLSVVGLKRIHYHLLAHGYQSHLLHNTTMIVGGRRGLDQIGDFAAGLNPLFIGVSVMATEFEPCRELSEHLRRRLPGVPIVWGGPLPTLCPELCLPPADYVCRGEGELASLDLARALERGEDPAGVKNLVFRRDGNLVMNPLHPLIEDLDALPQVDHIARNSFVQDLDLAIRPLGRELTLRFGRYQGKFYDMLTMIGCPFNCTYCCSSSLTALYGRKRIRKRSVENCIEELERAAAGNDILQLVNFQDDNFLTHDARWIEHFASEYERRVRLPFMLACIPLYVTEQKVARLRRAGLTWVRMGLQSGSDQACREVFNRPSYRRHFFRAMELFKQYGVSVYTDVILDNPFETEADQFETIEALAAAPRPYYLQLYSLSPFHGTAIRERIMRECPEKLLDPTRKDYLQLAVSPLNRLTRLAAYLPPAWTRRLLAGYRRAPRSIRFRIEFAAAQAAGAGFFEPFTLFRVVKQAEGGGGRLIRNAPAYVKILVSRYLTRFRGN